MFSRNCFAATVPQIQIKQCPQWYSLPMNQPELYLGFLNGVYKNLLKLAFHTSTVFVYEEKICNHQIYNS